MLKNLKAIRALVTLMLLAFGLQSTLFVVSTPAAVHWNGVQSHARLNAYERTYQKAWQHVRDNYYDRARLKDWDKWQHKFDGKLTNREKLSEAVNEMVDSLGDDFTFILSAEDLAQRQQQFKQRAVSAARVIRGNIGYIKLDNFLADTTVAEMQSALRKLARVDGMIIDLRGNHGGYVAAAQDIFSMLADDGVFMSYEGFLNGTNDSHAFVLKRNSWNIMKNGKLTTRHRKPNLLANRPLVVLVDEDTRSASEMLAGALRDNNKALVIGKQTFGKGVLQDAYEIGNRLAVKVVTARYFLPSGNNIHETGIAPDIEIDGTPQAQLARAADLLVSAIAEARTSGRRVLAVMEQSAGTVRM